MTDCAYIGCDRQVETEGDTCDMECYTAWQAYWRGYFKTADDLTHLPDDAIVPSGLKDQPWYEAEVRRT